MTIRTTAKKFAVSGVALASAIGLAACSATDKAEKPATLSATEIIQKTATANSLEKLADQLNKDQTLAIDLDLDVATPEKTNDVKGTAKFLIDFDADSKTTKASWDIDIPALTAQSPQFPKELTAYAEQKQESTYEVFINYNGTWVKGTADLKNLLGSVAPVNPADMEAQLADFLKNVEKYADVTTTESGDQYHVNVNVKESTWEEIIKGAAKDDVKLDPKSLKGTFDIYVDKETFAITEVTGVVNLVSTDGGWKVVADLNLKHDVKADVKVEVPAEARDKAIDMGPLSN